jgi:hypothetical protein
VRRTPRGFFLSQEQYAEEIMQHAGMVHCKTATTPVDALPKVAADTSAPVADPSEYRSLAGALQYLTMTRSDLANVVQQVCLHMHDPRDGHLAIIKRILRYVCGTMSSGLLLHSSSPLDIVAYSDADWAGCPDTRRSTSGYCVYLDGALVSWSSKRQPTVSCSSAEAEYRIVANTVVDCVWLRQLLEELGSPPSKATVVFCDNTQRCTCLPIKFIID